MFRKVMIHFRERPFFVLVFYFSKVLYISTENDIIQRK
jgi:hypothetical protein